MHCKTAKNPFSVSIARQEIAGKAILKYCQYKGEIDLSKKLLFEQQNKQGSLLNLYEYKFKNNNNPRFARDDFLIQNKTQEYPINYFQTEAPTDSTSNQKAEKFITKQRNIFKASYLFTCPRKTRKYI